MPASLEQEIRALRAYFWSDRDPQGRAFAPLADVYLRMGDLDEARSLLEDGLSRHPDFVPGLLVAARVARADGNPAGAGEHLEHLLLLDPDNVVGLGERSRLHRGEGREIEAEADLARARELEPGFEPEPEWETAAPPPLEAESTPAPEPASGVVVEGEVEDDDFTDLSALSWEGLGIGEVEGTEPEAPEAESVEEVPADDVPVDDVPWADAPVDDVVTDEEDEAVFSFESAFDAAFGMDRGSGDNDEEELPVPTRTLAELYLRQGLHSEALRVYRALLAASPGDGDLEARIAELEDGIEAGDEAGADAPILESPPSAAPLTTPPWEATGRPVRDYFVDLFSWVPGAVPIETLAPGAEGAEEGETVHPSLGDGSPGPSSREPESPAPEEDEGLDDFQAWLKSLNS